MLEHSTQVEIATNETDLGTAKTVPAGRANARSMPDITPQPLAAASLSERLTLPSRRLRLRRVSNATGILLASAALGVIAGSILLKKMPPPRNRGAVAGRAAPALDTPTRAAALEAPLATKPTPAAVTQTPVATGDHEEEPTRAHARIRRQGHGWHRSRARKAHVRPIKAPSGAPNSDEPRACFNAEDQGWVMGADLQRLQRHAEPVAIDAENPYP